MKIDRVILSANNNPVYYPFWNVVSKVYATKFNIVPTLIWVGTEKEANSLGISDEHGDIIYAEPHPDYATPWQCTWALYWGTQYFPEDTCLVCGIDELPLGSTFIKDIPAPYDDDKYLMMIADAYMPNHWTTTASPSGYHCAKGKTFDEIYSFESDFQAEMTKVYNSGLMGFWETTEGRWGLDENYFSHKLRQYSNRERIVSLDNFGLMCKRRIECYRDRETEYNIDALRGNWYAHVHFCRPYTNHVNYINTICENVPQVG